MNFYIIAIGTELLDQRREDLNTPFLIKELAAKNLKIVSVSTIKDDPATIKNCFEAVKKDKNSVLFCFGGIGATPDDYTRKCAADVFTNGELEYHKDGIKILEGLFGQLDDKKKEMVRFPKNSKLIFNPINQIPAFSLEDRLFFMPGFPSMAHAMINNILDRYFLTAPKEHRFLLTAFVSEGKMGDIMEKLPDTVTLSCLPDIREFGKRTSISISSQDEAEAKRWFDFFIGELKRTGIDYVEGDLAGGV